jgi:hypothetical protein
MIFELLLLAAAPSTEAEALGMRLAKAGTLAALLPMMEVKETEELVAQHKQLSAAEQAQLRATAQEVATTSADRLFAAEGRAYAAELSVEDLRALVAHAESGPAKRMRAAQPKVIAATMQSVGGIDFKKDVLAAFCAKTGKACAK